LDVAGLMPIINRPHPCSVIKFPQGATVQEKLLLLSTLHLLDFNLFERRANQN
jgi:hypothetical protein